MSTCPRIPDADGNGNVSGLRAAQTLDAVLQFLRAQDAPAMDIGWFVKFCAPSGGVLTALESVDPQDRLCIAKSFQNDCLAHVNPNLSSSTQGLKGHECGKGDVKYLRFFNPAWLVEEQFQEWLVYSKEMDKAYCRVCSVFPSSKEHGNESLAINGTSNYAHAKRNFTAHLNSGRHKGAMAAMRKAKGVNGETATIVPLSAAMTISAKRQHVDAQRGRLLLLIDVLLTLAKQGLAIRGHKEPTVEELATMTEQSQTPLDNPGNFLTILLLMHRHCAQGTDHLFRLPRLGYTLNPAFLHHDIQNELIHLSANEIRADLRAMLTQANFFSVLADEATDTSNHSQLAIAVRYVHPSSHEIHESLLGFVKLEKWTGEHLANVILEFLVEFGLDLNKMCGQGYDGAGAMAGCVNGCQALIRRQYPQARYFHCASHQLSLCVSNACLVGNGNKVALALTVVDELWRFFKDSPKRLTQYQSFSDSTQVVKGFAPTRWVQRVDAINDVINRLSSSNAANGEGVQHFIKAVADSSSSHEPYWNTDTITSARGIYNNLCDFSNLFCLVVLQSLMTNIGKMTVQLQGVQVDLICAYELLTANWTELSLMRSSEDGIEDQHAIWFEDALKIWRSFEDEGRDADSMPVSPRGFGNIDVSNYYRTHVSIPLLDRFIAELGDRFGELQQHAALGMFMLPRYCLPTQPTEHASAESIAGRVQKLVLCCSSFNALLRSHPTEGLQLEEEMGIDEKSFKAELRVWDTLWLSRNLNREQLDKLAIKDLLARTDILWAGIPQVHRLVLLLATIPVTTCTVERSISQLGLIKTHHRSTMTQQRFTDLCLLKCHRAFPINTDVLIKKFAGDNLERRGNLLH